MQQMAMNLFSVIAPSAGPAVFLPGQAADMPPAVEGFPQVLARLGTATAQTAARPDVKGPSPDSIGKEVAGVIGKEIAGVSVDAVAGFVFAAGQDVVQLPAQLQAASGFQGGVNAAASAVEDTIAPVSQADGIEASLVMPQTNAVQTNAVLPASASIGDAPVAGEIIQAAPQQAAPQQAATPGRSPAEGQAIAAEAGLPRSVGAAIQAFFTTGSNQAEPVMPGAVANPGQQNQQIQQMERPAGPVQAVGGELQIQSVASAEMAGDARQLSPTVTETVSVPQQVLPAGVTVQPAVEASADVVNVTAPPAKVTQADVGEAKPSLQPVVSETQDRPAAPASPEALPRTADPADVTEAPLRTSQPAMPAVDPRNAEFRATGARQVSSEATSEGAVRPGPDAASGRQAVSSAVAPPAGSAGLGQQPVGAHASGQGQTSQPASRPAVGLTESGPAPAQVSDAAATPQQLQTAPQPQAQPAAGQAMVAPQPTAAPEPGSFQAGSSAPAQQPATPPSPAANQVGLSIARAVADGQSRFTVRLDPPELGRIDIRLEMSADGTLRAVIRADSQDTLDLMQRDARQLERALAETGLKTDSGSLSFSLNQQGQGGRFDGFGQSQGQAAADASDDAAADQTMVQTADADDGQTALRLSGLETDSIDITI